MGAVLSALFEIPVEPSAIRDKEILEGAENEEREDSPYRLIRRVYERAAAITKEKKLKEQKYTAIDREELARIIERTSIRSIVAKGSRRTRETPKVDDPRQQSLEGVIDLDMSEWSEESIPSEFREQDSRFHFINPNETLEGIALQYSVRISDSRRLNSIHNTQDFHSRETLIIPSFARMKGATLPAPLLTPTETIKRNPAQV